MKEEQLNEQLEDYCNKYSSFRYNDFHFPSGWNEEQMDVYRESKMEEYLNGIKELVAQEERNKVLSEVQSEVWKANYSKYILEDISTIIESLKVK